MSTRSCTRVYQTSYISCFQHRYPAPPGQLPVVTDTESRHDALSSIGDIPTLFLTQPPFFHIPEIRIYFSSLILAPYHISFFFCTSAHTRSREESSKHRLPQRTESIIQRENPLFSVHFHFTLSKIRVFLDPFFVNPAPYIWLLLLFAWFIDST